MPSTRPEAPDKATKTAQQRYDRVAPFYDLMQYWSNRGRVASWRRLLWSKASGSHILEIGVGTGKNFSHYPREARITAFDLSPRMLRIAQDKVRKSCLPVELLLTDAQKMGLAENSFDTAAASLVFCSVPDPVQGLKEVHRVLRPGGKVILLEHIRSPHPLLGKLMDWLNPLMVRLTGANINRHTVANVEKSGLRIEKVTNLWGGIILLIEARK